MHNGTAYNHPPAWRLIVTLRDRSGDRDVWLDFVTRVALDSQLTSFARLRRRRSDVYEFENEQGEVLAFRADGYLRHTIASIPSRIP